MVLLKYNEILQSLQQIQIVTKICNQAYPLLCFHPDSVCGCQEVFSLCSIILTIKLTQMMEQAQKDVSFLEIQTSYQLEFSPAPDKKMYINSLQH